MDEDKISFRTSSYFPTPIKLLWSFGLLAGGIVATNFMSLPFLIPTLGVLAAATAALFTTHYRVDIRFLEGTVHEYCWVLGARIGKPKYFEKIEFLFINKNKVSQTMGMFPQTTTFTEDVYDGYIKFSKSHKVHLFSKPTREAALKTMLPIVQRLNQRLVDFSSKKPKEIKVSDEEVKALT